MDGNMDRPVDDGYATGMGQGGTEGTVDRAKDTARSLVSDARDMATERVESRKNRAADTLSGVARSLRSSTDQLQDDEFGAGQFIRQAADQVERLAGFLQHRDVDEMLAQAEDFARRQPALFVGTAFAAGMLGARFLKSSRSRLYDDGWSGQDGDYRGSRRHTGDFYSAPPESGYTPATNAIHDDVSTPRDTVFGTPSNLGERYDPEDATFGRTGYAASAGGEDTELRGLGDEDVDRGMR